MASDRPASQPLVAADGSIPVVLADSGGAMMANDDFHDATFLGADIRWPDGVAVLRFRVHPAREVTIVARGFSNLSVPRTNACGPSNSVNHVRWAPGGGTLDIEMQSGDTIHVMAAEFSTEWPT